MFYTAYVIKRKDKTMVGTFRFSSEPLAKFMADCLKSYLAEPDFAIVCTDDHTKILMEDYDYIASNEVHRCHLSRQYEVQVVPKYTEGHDFFIRTASSLECRFLVMMLRKVKWCDCIVSSEN